VASRRRTNQDAAQTAEGVGSGSAGATTPQLSLSGTRPWLVALVLLTLAVFGWLVPHDFVSWDDYATVARNPNIAAPTAESLAYHWRHPHMDLYVPLTYTAWWALAAASGAEGGALNASVFHAANVAVHAASAAVLFLLLRRLGLRSLAAFMGAALFAVHPVQVESVAWVSGLKDVLCGLLSLVSVWQYVEYASGTVASPRRRAHYAIAAAAFILALLAKPTAVVVPAIAFVLDTLVLRRPARQSLMALGPWLLAAVACLAWTKAVQPAHYAATSVPLYLRPLVAADALAFYIYKLVWPAALAIDYGRTPEAVISHRWAYFTWLVPAAVAALLIWQRRRRPLVVAGALIFLIGVAPVLGLVRFDFQLISTTSDHYLYLSMAGIALAAAALLDRLYRSRAAIAIASLLLAMLAVRSIVQTRHWRDTFALFRHAVAVNPESWVAHNSLAAAYVEAGRGAPAVEHARLAAELRQDDVRVWGTLASALATQGRYSDAADAYRRALQFEPDNARVHASLAGLLAQQNQLDPAMNHARRAIELDPRNAQARLNYGTMLAQSGRIDEGIEQLREAIRLAPRRLPQAHANLGMLYLSKGQPDQAAIEFQRALMIDPRYAPARAGLQRATTGAPGPRQEPPGR
jgi:tetratricopeptide (TPR) repeat protein